MKRPTPYRKFLKDEHLHAVLSVHLFRTDRNKVVVAFLSTEAKKRNNILLQLKNSDYTIVMHLTKVTYITYIYIINMFISKFCS